MQEDISRPEMNICFFIYQQVTLKKRKLSFQDICAHLPQLSKIQVSQYLDTLSIEGLIIEGWEKKGLIYCLSYSLSDRGNTYVECLTQLCQLPKKLKEPQCNLEERVLK